MSTMNQLEGLKKFTAVVADTGDFENIRQFKPQDATTNPSLIYKATSEAAYTPLLDKSIADLRGSAAPREQLVRDIVDDLLTAFGEKILKIVPGRVSTEVDARLSFDTEATIEKARKIIGIYEKRGVSRDRVLIKVASTWEGICAAEVLQKEGIHCNLTLLFSMPQAIRGAEVGAQLISPFVGRIYDWYKAHTGKDYRGAEDPGVQSVRKIYDYYKKFDYKTEVMGASFRNTSQILALAGCDLLTISPELMEELSKTEGTVERQMCVEEAKHSDAEKISMNEKKFRWMLNEDAMATDKLAEGIRKFTEDIYKLEDMIERKLG